MVALWKRLWTEEEGQGMAEYGLIIALVAIGVITTLGLLGSKLKDVFTGITNAMPTSPS